MMKKLLSVILAAAAICPLLRAQTIHSVDIGVLLLEDGSAYVSQLWDVTVVSGTEWYIPIDNLGEMEVSELEVIENERNFVYEGRKWDTNRSLEQKEGRCGIVDKGKGSLEICWGQGSPGHHSWRVRYKLSGLLQSLNDYDAFNFQFINDQLPSGVGRASFYLKKNQGEPMNSENTRFWFFGCEGDSEMMEDGSIYFQTSDPIPYEGSLICMVRCDKGLFSPGLSRKMDFAKMQKKAFKGSSYSDGKGAADYIGIAIGIMFVLAIVFVVLLVIYLVFRDIFCAITGRTWKKEVFGASKVEGWEREAPYGGNLPVAAYLYFDNDRRTFHSPKTERILGACFLKWIYDGTVTPVQEGEKIRLLFPQETPEFEDDCEKSLFEASRKAAGENRLLEEKEFSTWARKHPDECAGFPKRFVRAGRNKLEASGQNVSENAKLLKFKNFLNDFTLSREHSAPEVSLWGQYLIFAQIFGIADKVRKGLADLYPSEFEEFCSSRGFSPATMQTMSESWTSTALDAFRSAKSTIDARSSSSGASGGFGGHSSFGGGGGFSGGGHGGGSR